MYIHTVVYEVDSCIKLATGSYIMYIWEQWYRIMYLQLWVSLLWTLYHVCVYTATCTVG